MKRFLCLITAFAALVSTVQAEGYQVNTLSAKQLGMGHVGVSMKLDSESLWFNPAGAAYQESRFHISGGVTAIDSHAEYSTINNYTDPVVTTKSDNPLSTPIYFYANFKATEDLSLGLSFNTPFGSSMNWGDSWSGAHIIQDISLMAYSLQPTVSYKFLDDRMSVGVGLMLSWGTVNLSRSLLPISMNSTIAAMVGDYGADITAVGDNPLVSAEISADTKLAVGVNVGVMYDINERWTVGASYRSRIATHP
ncbi:MAG: outer membrane protein transport protein, partial [Rikenellaceae bacterium]